MKFVRPRTVALLACLVALAADHARGNGCLGPGLTIPQERKVDVVIIGAGMAGLIAAKRLLQEDPDLDVLILESQDKRVGGRVRSNNEWFIDDMTNAPITVEEGANWF